MAEARKMDMTEGSLGDKILLFVIPVAITAILQQLLNTTDSIVVGQFIGDGAVAAVGGNAAIISFIVSLFQGISLGANVVIATAIGARDEKSVHEGVHTAIVIAVVGGILSAIACELLVEPIVGLLGVPSEVYDMSMSYLRCYLLGLPVLFLYDFEAAIYRAKGDTTTPLISLIVAAIANIGLDLFFVLGLGHDVDGVAIGTVISMGLAAIILFVGLIREKGWTRLDPRQLHVDRPTLVRILKIGVPAGAQGSLFSISNIVIQSAINSLGETIMSASSCAYYLEILAYYTINSFGQACTTFVGQNNGARKPDRCRRTLVLCLAQGAVATLLMCGGILFFHVPLLGMFTHSDAVVSNAFLRLCYIFSAYGFSLVIENVSGYLRGFGLSFVPAVVALVCIVGFRLLWVFFVFAQDPSWTRLLAAYPVTLGLNALGIGVVFLIVRHHLGGSLSRAKATESSLA